MNLIRLFPVFFAFLLIAAHFTRSGQTVIAIGCLLIPSLLFFIRPWSVRTVQVALLLASAEWVYTTIRLVNWRMDRGLDWHRLVMILGGVALFTALTTLIFRHQAIRRKYRLSGSNHKHGDMP